MDQRTPPSIELFARPCMRSSRVQTKLKQFGSGMPPRVDRAIRTLTPVLVGRAVRVWVPVRAGRPSGFRRRRARPQPSGLGRRCILSGPFGLRCRCVQTEPFRPWRQYVPSRISASGAQLTCAYVARFAALGNKIARARPQGRIMAGTDAFCAPCARQRPKEGWHHGKRTRAARHMDRARG